MIYCEDCRFYREPPFPGEFGKAHCTRPREVQPIERVARAAAKQEAYCDLERTGNAANSCGQDAKWFEPAKQTVAA